MTYPIRSVPDGDTAWGADLRATIAGVNDHQSRLTAIESGSGESANFTGDKVITGKLGVNATPGPRQPINLSSTITGAGLPGTQDKVAMALLANASGDFTGDTGSNPGFFWGLNLFTTTGAAAGDGNGITSFNGALIESAIRTPAGTTLPYVVGLAAEAAFFGASSGATVTQMESLRVCSVKRKDGASSGTVGTAYALFIEDQGIQSLGGSAVKFSLFVEGGISRIQGRMDISGELLSYNAALDLRGDYSGAGRIRLNTNGIGFYGTAPVTRPTLPAAGSVTASDIRTALLTLGLCV